MDLAPYPAPMTRDTFLDWAERQELPYEFDGLGPVPMNGGSVGHYAIASRILFELMVRLEGRPNQVISAGAGVMTIEGGVRFPDVVITRSPVDAKARLIPDPVIVFEVSSPSSVRVDRYTKATEYAAVPSILRYIIVEQDSIDAAVMFRTEGSQPWTLTTVSGGAMVQLPEVGIEVSLMDFYKDVEMPA